MGALLIRTQQAGKRHSFVGHSGGSGVVGKGLVRERANAYVSPFGAIAQPQGAGSRMEVAVAPTGETWVGEVYGLVEAGNIEMATYTIFREVHRLCASGRFQDCDTILRSIDLARLDINTSVCFLMSTKAATAKLSGRKAYAARVRERLQQTEAKERVDNLLRGLQTE